MPILRDKNFPDNYIEFTVVKHNPSPGEGGYYNYKYVVNSEIVKEAKFGWTNMVLNSFIPSLLTYLYGFRPFIHFESVQRRY